MADITSNLDLYAPLNGNGNDASGNGRHFTPQGTPGYGTGILGQALIGPNTTNYLTIANPSWLNSATALTIACWVKSSTYRAGAAAWSVGGSTAGIVTVCYPYDFGVRIFSNGGTPVDRAGDGLPANNGQWVFTCWRVFNSTSAKYDFYQTSNSTWYQSTTTLNCTMPATVTGLRIGMYHNGGQGYFDDIDEFRVYRRALADADVTALMQATLTPFKAAWASRCNQLVATGA